MQAYSTTSPARPWDRNVSISCSSSARVVMPRLTWICPPNVSHISSTRARLVLVAEGIFRYAGLERADLAEAGRVPHRRGVGHAPLVAVVLQLLVLLERELEVLAMRSVGVAERVRRHRVRRVELLGRQQIAVRPLLELDVLHLAERARHLDEPLGDLEIAHVVAADLGDQRRCFHAPSSSGFGIIGRTVVALTTPSIRRRRSGWPRSCTTMRPSTGRRWPPGTRRAAPCGPGWCATSTPPRTRRRAR